MVCPQTHTLAGEKTIVGPCRDTENDAFRALLEESAGTFWEIGKRYRCPSLCCSWVTVNSIGATGQVHVSRDRGLEMALNPPGSSEFPFTPPRLVDCFRGYGVFRFEIRVTCSKVPASALKKYFLAQFVRAAKAFYDPYLTGSLGNLAFGKKCDEWADWMVKWILENGWKDCGIRVEKVIYAPGTWSAHVLVRVTFPDGSVVYLDPWRDGPDQAVHDKAEYEQTYGPPDDSFSY